MYKLSYGIKYNIVSITLTRTYIIIWCHLNNLNVLVTGYNAYLGILDLLKYVRELDINFVLKFIVSNEYFCWYPTLMLHVFDWLNKSN